ncbi:hypothetical protein AB0M39_39565 [Streptomyces sp. NPDC051907]|uniref:hypothetical protein n=1 Tax=Streptomyces sp. NPDC051907 TaxID=3155284 RepID=UPI00343E3594
MAWAYAELAKEASRRGGPLALRRFYTGQGVVIGGVVASAAIAGTLAHDKRSKRRAAAAAAAEAAPAATGAPAPGDASEPGRS